ncbi:MAG: inorganic diphosphatase [bacterium]
MSKPFSYWKRLPPKYNGSYLSVIEIPSGEKVKYEYSKDLDVLILDRILYSSVHYPENYGFVPSTLADDGDPLDVLVFCQESIEPMTAVGFTPVGGLEMIDEKGLDHKIFAVASQDPQYKDYNDIDDLPNHKTEEIRQFFEDYKQLEDKKVELDEFYGPDRAERIVDESISNFRESFPEETDHW